MEVGGMLGGVGCRQLMIARGFIIARVSRLTRAPPRIAPHPRVAGLGAALRPAGARGAIARARSRGGRAWCRVVASR